MKRICRKCNLSKNIQDFCKNKECEFGYTFECKECRRNYINSWHKNNPEKSKFIQIRNYNKNKIQKSKYGKIYRENNKEWIAEKRKINRERDYPAYLNYFKNYKNKNRSKLIVKRREYKNKKRQTDPTFRIKESLRTRLQTGLRKYNLKKSENLRTQELIGCTFHTLKEYLEAKFLPTMSWNNYGKYWHIDHIIPCSKFDLTEEEEQKKCFHYTNLQPLFAITQEINNFQYIGNLNKNNKTITNYVRQL
jgi:hypothetical protein